MNKLFKGTVWLFILSMSSGFRVFPGKWQISKSDPTVWIKLCDSDFAVDTNDMPSNDPLVNVNGLTYYQIIQSVIDDYNSVPSSFVRLALYPADPNNPGTPAAGDSAFSIATAATRTIQICFDGTNPAAGLSGGHAQAKYESGNIIGCEIKGRSDNTKKARFLTHLVTHELGHCFGLMHPQESTNSVMSYFNNDDVFTRLQNDDDAGLSFRYPEDEAYAKEENTYGLKGCSPK